MITWAIVHLLCHTSNFREHKDMVYFAMLCDLFIVSLGILTFS